MIECKELNKSFDTKEELFKALKANKDFIIRQKKGRVWESIDKDCLQAVKVSNIDFTRFIDETTKDFFNDPDSYYIVVNTTNILDSHGDLHVKGIWNKTAKEQNNKNYLVDTHNLTMGTTLAKKEDVEIFVAEIPFSALKYNYKGNTEALVYKVAKDKMRKDAREWLDEGYDVQASVKMQYVNIELALNSNSEEDKKERESYDRYKSSIANLEDFKELNYFFVVKEAKNIHESSLVPFGSNHVTGKIESQPSKDTDEQEYNKAEAVETNTSNDELNKLLQEINNKF